jgi:hypothetical protein
MVANRGRIGERAGKVNIKKTLSIRRLVGPVEKKRIIKTQE